MAWLTAAAISSQHSRATWALTGDIVAQPLLGTEFITVTKLTGNADGWVSKKSTITLIAAIAGETMRTSATHVVVAAISLTR